MSRVVRFYELGGPEVLKVEDRAIPHPEAGEIGIRVEAIGLNRADVMFRRGTYLERANLPSSLGMEAAGTVYAVGDQVSDIAVGDMVSLLPGLDLGRFGTYADHICVPSHAVVRLAQGASAVAGAAIWMAYVTAYGGLIRSGGLQAGQRIAITAASSSVGLAAIQVARQVGAEPIAVTLTSSKRQAILAAGALEVIATEEEALGGRLQELGGIHAAFDAVGGPQIEQLAEATHRGGTIVVHGALSPDPTPFPLRLALRKSLTLRGYVYTEIIGNPKALAEAQRFILDGMSSSQLVPHIDRTFKLENVVEAHRYLEKNTHFGKVVMTTG